MPPDGVYPPRRTAVSRAATDRQQQHSGSTDLVPLRNQMLHRSRSAYYERPPRSPSRGRNSYLSNGRYDDHDWRPRDDRKDHHIAASLAGAVAGGYLGRETSKGDRMATVLGAVVGAVGANVAEREWERHKQKDRREEEQWEMKWGRR
jgi:hypothetical protein